MSQVKVKILTNNSIAFPEAKNYAWVNLGWLYIKHWYNLYGQGDVEWLLPGVVIQSDIDYDEYVDKLVAEKPSIVGFGLFAWNDSYQYKIASKLKEKSPSTKIVFGGPNLSVHKTDDTFNKNSEFFIRHPYVDYVVYGDGERALQTIIDYEFFNIGDKSNFVNIIENCSGERKIYDYELLNDDNYWKSDPYNSNKDYIYSVANDLSNMGIGKKYQRWIVEFSRGCMYSCTFCDWSQNLSKKVKRRKASWKDTIDFWVDLDVTLREADANFGMWKEDILLFNYALSKYDPNRNFKLVIENTPKLDKSVAEHIHINSIKTYGQHAGLSTKISVQDIHKDVLTAINRPSLPWENVKQSIEKIIYETEGYTDFSVSEEVIVGLPNQTLDYVVENLAEFFVINKGKPAPVGSKIYKLTYLPNAPLADEDYMKKWGLEFRLEYKLTEGYHDEHVVVDNVEDLFATFKDDPKFFSFPVIYRTNHMSRLEIQSVYVLDRLISDHRALLKQMLVKYGEQKVKDVITNSLKNKAIERAKQNLRLDLEEKYQIAYNGAIIGNKIYKHMV
jgi:radical SAM superfamily enzyme YgiQ (UPF0313 family)